MEKPGVSVLDGILGGMSNDIPSGLSDVARFQAGVVSRQQALRSGMSRSAITSKSLSGYRSGGGRSDLISSRK
jgi:hypothetical protein